MNLSITSFAKNLSTFFCALQQILKKRESVKATMSRALMLLLLLQPMLLNAAPFVLGAEVTAQRGVAKLRSLMPKTTGTKAAAEAVKPVSEKAISIDEWLEQSNSDAKIPVNRITDIKAGTESLAPMTELKNFTAPLKMLPTMALFQSGISLEMGATGPTATGPSTAAQAVTLFESATIAYAPTTTVTYSFSNQQFPAGTVQGLSANPAANFGVGVSSGDSPLVGGATYALMNSIGAATNAMFTACNSCAAGSSLDVAVNKAVNINLITDALINSANANLQPVNTRVYYGDVTITFNRPVSNPVLQFVGMGGQGSYTISSVSGGVTTTRAYDLGFAAEFDLVGTDVTLSKLNGNTALNVTSNSITNSSARLGSSSAGSVVNGITRTGASGSVLATGTNISSITLKMYIKGDGGVVQVTTNGGTTWAASTAVAPYEPKWAIAAGFLNSGTTTHPGSISGDTFLMAASIQKPVTVSGTVFNDTNGLSDSIINGTGTNAGGLFAILVDSLGDVVASVAVPSTGIYSFPGIGEGSYTVRLSTTAGVVGSPAPAISLPLTWDNTGEGTAASGDGTVDGNTAITVVPGVHITGVNFGISQPSLSLAKTNPTSFLTGTAANYSLTISNAVNHVTTGNNVVVNDKLPPNFAYNSAAAGTGATAASCISSGTLAAGLDLVCTITTTSGIAGGASAAFTINVTPQPGAGGVPGINKAAVDPVGGTPVAPSTCTATGTPAGCAVAPSITPLVAPPPAANPANLNTHFTDYTTTCVTYDYTGVQVNLTAPAGAVGMHVKAWGAGGGNEIIVSDVYKAGAGGFTEAVFGNTVVTPGAQFAVVVGAGGNSIVRPPDASPAGVFGFGGAGVHDQGGGLSGIFTGATALTNTSQSRALAIAGGGGGADHSGGSSEDYAGGTNGNGSLSGGAVNMQGSTDSGFTSTGCPDSFYPANYFSSGGGGYSGGGRTNYMVSNCSAAGAAVASGKGGSGFVASSRLFESLEWTSEIGAVPGVNVTARTTDSSYGNDAQGKPIGRAGVANATYTPAINGGGHGRVVICWVIQNDHGDAPATYGDAAHAYVASPTVYLGTTAPDMEVSAATPLDGTGDDATGTNDEDAVNLTSVLAGATSVVPVAITGSGRLNAWFDWNRDGDFADAGEQVATDLAATAGTTNLSVAVPAGASPGASYARFRLCSTAGNCNTPTGNATDGEVEDYPVTISLLAVAGFKSVKLTTDNDNSGTVTAGDTLTWTVQYANTGTTDVPNFQIADQLPAGITITAAGAQTVTVSGSGTTATKDNAYTGASLATSMALASGATLAQQGTITLTIPVTVNAGFTGSLSNQASASGTGMPAAVSTDNAGATSDLPATVTAAPFSLTVPDTSVTQTINPTIDPTLATVVAAPTVAAYKSVNLTTDADSSGSVTPGDTLTYTLQYANTGTVDVTGFQLNDVLPVGVTITGTGNQTLTITGSTTAAKNTNYTGALAGAVSELLAATTTFKAGDILKLEIPVTINAGASGTLLNQALGTGTNLPAPGVKTDNVDNVTSGLPPGVTVPTGSLTQTQNPTLDPTALTIANAPTVLAFKSVKLTTDVNSNTQADPGDTLIWSVWYKNSGTVDVTTFQINDVLPAGVTITGAGNQTVTVTGTTTATKNTSYTGAAAGAVSEFLSATTTFKAGDLIQIDIPVTINPGFAGSIQNQATGTGGNLPPAGVITDNADISSTGLPSGVTIPTGSAVQTLTPALDPTSLSVTGIPAMSLVKSVTPTGDQQPGTDLTYKIVFTNTGNGAAQEVVIFDPIPTETDFKLGSATTTLGTTGLTMVIEYSNDFVAATPATATWTYVPVTGGGGADTGYDRNVKAVRWRVSAGILSQTSPNHTGDVGFTVKIR